MSKNVENKLKFMLIGVALMMILFTVIAFAVPFVDKFSGTYWIGFAGAFANGIAAVFFLAVAFNADDYKNDKLGSLIGWCSLLTVVIGIAVGIVFMAIQAEIWVAALVVAAQFVVLLMGLFYILLTNKNEEPANE